MTRTALPLSSIVAIGLTVIAAVAAFSAAAPTSARADHCQAEELIVRMVPGFGNFESPAGEDADDPRCYVGQELGCETQADPPRCISGIVSRLENAEPGGGCDDAPGGRPILVERLICEALGDGR